MPFFSFFARLWRVNVIVQQPNANNLLSQKRPFLTLENPASQNQQNSNKINPKTYLKNKVSILVSVLAFRTQFRKPDS